MPKMLRSALLYSFQSILHAGTSIHCACVVSLRVTHKHNLQLLDRLEYEPSLSRGGNFSDALRVPFPMGAL